MRGDFRGRGGRRRLAGTAALLALMASSGCSNEPDADNAGDTDPRPGNTSAVEERAEAAESADEERDPGEPPGETKAEKLTPPDEPEPVIDLTGPVEEIERIYRERDRYRSWLFRHPDSRNTERLARITHRDSPYWQVDHELLARYADENRWWNGGDDEVTDIEVVKQASRNFVTLHVTRERHSTAELVDESGAVYDQLPPARGEQEVSMRRGTFDPNQPHRSRAGDAWKLITVHDLEYQEFADAGEGS